MTLKYKKNIAIYFLIAMFFVLDRYLKNIFNNSEKSINIIGDIFRFSFIPNKYISFSIPLSGNALNIVISSLIILLAIYIIYAFRHKEYRYQIPLLFFILLGATSNILDRLQFGYVIDYLDLKYFTVFNVADAMIFIGAVLLIFSSAKQNKKDPL